jgi:adenylate cyclase
MMGIDETGTLAAMRAHRVQLIDPAINEHGGRIVKTMGDGLLLEFPSVVDAVRCSIAVQEGMLSRNNGEPDEKQIVLRIGINLGDVIIDGDDIHGDGINIAARLESICEPSGICISSRVHDDVRDRLDVGFVDGGEQELKNIARPIQVWRWASTASAMTSTTASMNTPLALPDKPSIAVLPFDNMSGDAEQEYFVDGITEDLITSLSYQRLFPVIARNTTFVYKSKSVDVGEVGQELGAGYVVEGSVRKSGNRIRITAQLIDVASGHHIWAKRYDRELDDIFDLQDEITDQLVRAIAPELLSYERQKVRTRNPENLTAWDLYLQAQSAIHCGTQDDMAQAEEMARKIIDIAPSLAMGHATLARAMLARHLHNWGVRSRKSFAELTRASQLAIELDDRDAAAWDTWSQVQCFSGHHDQALEAAKRAVDLNPYALWPRIAMGTAHMFGGNPSKALPQMLEAERIGGSVREMLHVYGNLMWIYFFLGDNQEACLWGLKAIRMYPDYLQIHVGLAAAYAHQNDLENARSCMSEVYRLNANFDLNRFQRNLRWRDQALIEYTVAGLRKSLVQEE